jgi:hypothetical protein
MQEVTAMIMDSGHSREDILEYIKQRTDAITEESISAFAMSAKVSTAANSVGGKLGRRLIAGGAILMAGDEVEYVVLTKPIDEVKGCAVPRPVVYTKTGKVKKAKELGVTDRTATVEEVEECFGQGNLTGVNVSIDFEYYRDKLRTSADSLLVF